MQTEEEPRVPDSARRPGVGVEGEWPSPDVMKEMLASLRAKQEELERENTRLRRAQVALEQARARYFDLYELAPLGYATLSSEGAVIEANVTAATMLGVDRTALVSRSLRDYVLAADRGIFDVHQRVLRATGDAQTFRIRLTRGDGSLVWFRLDATLADDVTGRPVIRVMLNDITGRKAIEASLGQERSKLDAIVEASGAAVWEINFLEDRTLYSPAFHHLLGLPDGALGTDRASWRAFALAEDLPGLLAIFEEHLSTRGAVPYSGHVRLRHVDGSIVTVLATGRVIAWGEDGQPVRMVGCMIDISTQARAEAVARASEENFRTVMEHMHAGVFLKDAEGRWLVVNRAGLRLMGIEDLPCIGRTDRELAAIRPEMATVFEACIVSDERAWALGHGATAEEILPGPVGPVIIEAVKVPLFHPDGSRRGLVVVGEDVTEQRKFETHLRERDEQFTALTTHAPGLLYEFRMEPDGRYSMPYISANVRSVYGLEPEDVMRDANVLFRRVLAEDAERLRVTIQKSAETLTTWMCDYRIRHPDGSIRWLRGASTPRLLENGAVQWSGYKQDITQLKQAEAEDISRGKREVIERLAGGVAHDFNNYLTAIRVSAELMRDLPDAPPSVAELTQSLLGEIDSATRVARQLLAFTKDQPIRREALSLATFLRETAAFALRGSAVSAVVESGGAEIVVETDPVLLQQVLFNLLINARDAMGGRGVIHLSMSRGEPARICIRVTDGGPGIPVEQRAHVFEPYFTSKATGSGLGLHVAKNLMTRLGGEIRLDESAAGGASFCLQLPAGPNAAQLPARSSLPRPAAAPAHGERELPHVLLLEDEEVQVWLLGRFLKAIGVTFETFSTGEALMAAARALPQGESARVLCLLDITIKGGQGGLDIARPLREALPLARIFLVSGYSDAWDESAASFSAMDIGFIAKPYTLPDLRNKILSASA